MPSFVNLGAHVDSGTMIDTWATVGSCAQIGKNVHLSGGAGIGGVLEPLQANPVIIEDNCFIGARAEVAEGVIVGEGSVLSMGVYLGASTKIVDRATGDVHHGPRAALSRWWCPARCRASRSGRLAGPVALLRGDRQDGRRAHPGQDLDQRTAQGLKRQRERPRLLGTRPDRRVDLGHMPRQKFGSGTYLFRKVGLRPYKKAGWREARPHREGTDGPGLPISFHLVRRAH